jgi:hypothetical protein
VNETQEATQVIAAAWGRLAKFDIGSATPMMTLGDLVHAYLEAPTSDKEGILELLRQFSQVGDLSYSELRDLLNEMEVHAVEHLAAGKRRRRNLTI